MSDTPASLTRSLEYKLLEFLPAELQTSLPSIEQIERQLAGDGILWRTNHSD